MRSLVATLCLLMLASPCWSDWQYAKFGMTVNDLIAASAGKAKLGTAPGQNLKRGDTVTSEVLATSEHAFKQFVFDVYFGFDPNDQRLLDVGLKLRPGIACRELLNELRATYGAPNTSDPGRFLSTYTWRSEATNNHLTLHDIGGDHCSMRYTPLPRPAAGGL